MFKKMFNLLRKQEKGYHTKEVGKYKNGVLVKKYKSIREAERKEKHARSHIVECCKGKRHTAYGYEWRYIEE